MARYTPQFIAGVRHDYENTDKSLARIAADHGVSERTVNRMRDRERWARRSERVRDVAPAMQALRAATGLLASRETPPAARRIPPTPDPSPPFATLAGGGEAGPLASSASTIERIERLVERELEAEEAVRNRLGPLPRAPADAERCARTLATLTQTLHALARLRSGLLPDAGLSDDDMPRDIDEFRRELARRIRAFVQNRTGGGVREGIPAAGAAADQP